MKGEILKQLRKEKKLTQQQLAERLNVSRSVLAMIESEKQKGSIDLQRQIANFFNVSLDYLEGFTTEKNGLSDKRESLVTNFLQFLIKSGIIENENEIDEKTEEMILEMVKKEISNLKRGE
ncbi:MAG: helix-turn-helix transcriptional regulator [Clostridium sp.]|uniref:helix-turn-helix domain-containing protein n=1 Tax=Clostridium sp. TaxID=1506 RepID=UPI0025BC69AD|nr:helix-turn-helix transcriptional regulator [Clostridium sp.]MBS4958836.1 helix-turn-helix transcriptional regulator [Clostridium sp.]MDU1279160.1 helix-turn-helix transcriptional regulator [Clostridium sp.]